MSGDQFDRVVKIAVIVVLGVVVVVLSVVLGIVWSLPDIPETSNDQICLPSELGTLKCGQTTNLLHEFLERNIKEAYEQRDEEKQEERKKAMHATSVRLQNMMTHYYQEMKPAAKFTGKPFNITDHDKLADMAPIREWCTGRDLYDSNGFQRFEIRYRNGRIVVPFSGTYFVYSAVDFFEPLNQKTGKPDVVDPSKPIKHGIYKFNILDGEEREVVSSTQPRTVSSNNYFNAYSSYISSLVELKTGDELSVKVSNLTFLRYPRDNEFGVNFV